MAIYTLVRQDKMLARLNNIFRGFGTLLFPPYCYACERSLAVGESLICTYCRIRLPYTDIPHLEPDAVLKHRFSGEINLKYALAYLYFKRSGRVQRLLHALKYQGVQEIGLLLGQWYGRPYRKTVSRRLSTISCLFLCMPPRGGKEAITKAKPLPRA